jgi:XTP/dITP diphosphohydrolase
MSEFKKEAFFYLATQNKGKVKEFSLTSLAPFFKPLPPLDNEVEETGATCAENAKIKAKYYHTLLQAPVLSDDSGFFVETLGGYPGVHSAREAKLYGGFENVFREIESRATIGAKAYFLCVLCYCNRKGESFLFEGKLEGSLSFPAKGRHGFGYDPIFIPESYEKTFSQLEPLLKSKISHRALAIEKFKNFFFKNKIG